MSRQAILSGGTFANETLVRQAIVAGPVLLNDTVPAPVPPPPPSDGPASPTFVDKHGPTHRWTRKRLANEETSAERQARELRERVALGILPPEPKPTVAPALRERAAETEVLAREVDAEAQAVTAQIEARAREIAQQYAAESRRQAAQIAAALEAFEGNEEDAIAAILAEI